MSGCGNPFQKSATQDSQLAQTTTNSGASDGLIHLDPVPGSNSSVGGFAPISPPTQGLIDIIESQQSIPQTVESVVTDSPSTIVEEVVNTVEAVPEQTEQVVDQVTDISNTPVVEERVLENVLYISASTTDTVIENTEEQVNQVVDHAAQVVADIPVETGVAESVESTSLAVPSAPVVNNDNDEFEEDSAPIASVTTQEMAKAVDSSVSEALNQINYSDSTAENTTITYEKKKGKMETYYVYSQSSNSYDWTKELAVYVENGQIKLIQSLNKKDLSVFNVELAEIMAMEKDFSKKIKSNEVASMKETVVSYVVKSKKNKKTFKLPNKKFGKKKGTKKRK